MVESALQYALAAGYSGKIYPVNPNRSAVQGLKAYPDLASIPEEIDLVIIALPADAVASTVEAAGARGDHGADLVPPERRVAGPG